MDTIGWNFERQRYLITHAQDGVGLLAHALGVTEEEVLEQAERTGVVLTYGPSREELELCPACQTRYIRPRTNAAKAGLCPTCWNREKAEALRERQSYVLSVKEYEREKKRRQRRARAEGAGR